MQRQCPPIPFFHFLTVDMIITRPNIIITFEAIVNPCPGDHLSSRLGIPTWDHGSFMPPNLTISRQDPIHQIASDLVSFLLLTTQLSGPCWLCANLFPGWRGDLRLRQLNLQQTVIMIGENCLRAEILECAHEFSETHHDRSPVSLQSCWTFHFFIFYFFAGDEHQALPRPS